MITIRRTSGKTPYDGCKAITNTYGEVVCISDMEPLEVVDKYGECIITKIREADRCYPWVADGTDYLVEIYDDYRE